MVKASASVLKADKELVVFPALSAVLLVLVSASFLVPAFLTFEHQQPGHSNNALTYLLGFSFYLVTYFVMFFCNAALVGAALIRLRGGDPTVADGFRIAFSRIGAIFGYAVVAATVGIILKSIQERSGLLGRIVVGLIGLAWNVATFLVVPVLVTEEVGPIDAVKRSTRLLKQTWGEQFVGNFGIGAVTSLGVFLWLLVCVPAVVLAANTGSTPAIIGAVSVGVLGLLMLSLISATLSGIYTAAVYRYAAEGEIGFGFEADMVKDAFRPK